MLALGRHIFGLRSKPRAAEDLTAGNIYPPCLTKTGKRARKVLGTQGTLLGTDHNFFDEVAGGGGLENFEINCLQRLKTLK